MNIRLNPFIHLFHNFRFENHKCKNLQIQQRNDISKSTFTRKVFGRIVGQVVGNEKKIGILSMKKKIFFLTI
ncbi:hypothetical protein C1646_691077 [Rhizophagus diaphanus]|nr:hypothetical protein C1646_691077 [Rhizophagus diaphanus] [Rhizophagus sp. MUCL 43196]